MKEPYVEGIANHNGHESWADDREVVREALDSGMYRLDIEPRKQLIRVPTRSWHAEGNTEDINNARCRGLCVVGDPIHVQKLYARESEDPTIGLDHVMSKVRVENPMQMENQEGAEEGKRKGAALFCQNRNIFIINMVLIMAGKTLRLPI